MVSRYGSVQSNPIGFVISDRDARRKSKPPLGIWLFWDRVLGLLIEMLLFCHNVPVPKLVDR